MKRKAAALILLFVLALNAAFPHAGAKAEKAMPAPVFPAQGDLRPRSAGDPVLYIDRTEAEINETYALSWYESSADWCVLYVSFNGGEFVGIDFVATATDYYPFRQTDPGIYTYVIMTLKDGESWKQSNFVSVRVTADEETTCAFLRGQGMTNVWNLLFMVYRTVRTGTYERSFTDAQIASIRNTASEMKYTMEGLSGGRMQIGTVDLIVADEPITSVSGDSGYGDPPVLTYGMGQDVDFTYITDHKDITLVAVVAPLLGMNGGYSWLGLGGTYMRLASQNLYTVIINEIYTSGTRIECGGGYYLEDSLAFVHEILHAVETNSRSVGWDGFEALHSGDENGYGNGTYYWYRLLMSNEMDNGNKGFLRQSYYVRHRAIPASMRNGRHTDYDGAVRYYIDGLPHIIDLYLPSGTETIGEGAFLNTPAKSVLIPGSVHSIGENAFDPGTVLYAPAGSFAETWANQRGYTFIRTME